MPIDKRTLKIGMLKHKLESARDLIRELAILCVKMEDGKILSKAYWGEKAILKLEYTKE